MELTSLVIPLLLAAVAAWGAARRVDVYAALTDGAMDGLRVVLRICPNLIALLTAVYMFRASGALDLLTSLLAPALTALGIDPHPQSGRKRAIPLTRCCTSMTLLPACSVTPPTARRIRWRPSSLLTRWWPTADLQQSRTVSMT